VRVDRGGGKEGCACPHPNATACYQSRYPVGEDEDEDNDDCGCPCHDLGEDELETEA
jgi:hypothetical protein